MALSATFTANFSSFYDAVAKADASLKSFGDGAERVGTRINTLGNQFSGKSIIQEATLMAKAVEAVGGTSALTDKELARLGNTANEAVSKMRKLGMDVPANLQKVADETKGANKATVDWLGTLGKMAAAVGIAFSVDGVINFIGSIFDAADAVKNLSEQWGVSTKTVQQWTGAAKESGISAETVGKSLQFLAGNLSENSDQYRALLKNVGLSADALRAMPMDDAAREVMGAIGGIKDETLRLDVAMGLIGPSAKQMSGALGAGFLDAADKQKIMTDETIKRLADAQASWEKFKNAVVIWSGEMLGAAMKDASAAASGWGKLWGDIKATATGGMEGHRQYMASLSAAAAGAAAGVKAIGDANQAAAPAADAHAAGIRTTAQVAADLAKRTKDLAKAEADRAASQAAAKKVQDEYAKAIQDEADAVAVLAAHLEGGDLIGKANKYAKALETAIPVQKMTRAMQDEINKTMTEAIAVFKAAGEQAPEAFQKIADATAVVKETFAKQFGEINALMRDFKWGEWPPVPLPEPPKQGAFDGMGKGIGAAIGSSVMSNLHSAKDMVADAGSAIGSMILDPKQSKIGEVVVKAASKLPGLIGGAIGSAIPFVGPLIGPAIGMLANKISSWFGKKEHEKLRDSFVTAAGGMSVLREEAEKAGVSLDGLFKAKNADAVKKSMDEIKAAIDFQDTALDQAKEAASRYGFTLEELGPALAKGELDKQAQQLFKDWEVLNSAGVDTVAITDRMSDSVNEYIGHAMKMGAEIPSAMKPMLEAMAKSGTLMDENGDAITDLEGSGLKFSLTMSEGFKTMVDSVGKLTAAIERTLGPAIKNIPEPPPMTDAFGRIVKNAKAAAAEIAAATGSIAPAAAGTQGAPAAAEPPGYARGTGGFKNFGRGTPVILHGWEAVVPRDDAAGALATVAGAGAGGGSAAAAPMVVINAQGAFFDTPDSLQRLAARVSEALTAKYSVMGRLRPAV